MKHEKASDTLKHQPRGLQYLSPNKDETAVHGCHCQGDMAVRMRKVLQTAGLVFECVTCFFVFHFKFTDTPIGKNADPPPHTYAVGGRPCCPQPTATTCVVWSWRLKGCKSALAVKGTYRKTFGSVGVRRLCHADES